MNSELEKRMDTNQKKLLVPIHQRLERFLLIETHEYHMKSSFLRSKSASVKKTLPTVGISIGSDQVCKNAFFLGRVVLGSEFGPAALAGFHAPACDGIGALRLLLALRLREGVNSSWFARRRIDGRALTLKLSESGVFTPVAAAPPRGGLN